MPIYVLMTRLAAENMGNAEMRRHRGRDWLAKVAEVCPQVEWLGHYALLGRYDFMDLYRAPDDITAHKVSLISREKGAVTAESWPALPYDEHLQAMRDVGA